MPLTKNVEKRIWDIEEFAVTIRHGNGNDMRGDRTGVPMYPYSRASKDMTVSAWRETRFAPNYPGLEVDVLDGTNASVPGNTLLSTVRASYED